MIKLGVNIDHVATLRQARRGKEPDPVWAAGIAEMAGADGITVHLREDRRHIQDRDVEILRQTVRTRLNLEMAITPDIVAIACRLKPDFACLVPERRQEITTEGGLDVVGNRAAIKDVVAKLQQYGIKVSLFIGAERAQIEAAKAVNAEFIELHTGAYADAATEKRMEEEKDKLHEMAAVAQQLGLRVNAGHGLTYWNVAGMVTLPGIEEFNIGHSIMSRAIFVGLPQAIQEMKQAIQNALSVIKTGN